MNEMKPISNFRNNLYQVAIILLLAYAAFSTAMKDLDRLQQVAGNVQSATASGLGGLAKVYSATKSLAHGTPDIELAQAPETNSLIEPSRVDMIAAGGSVALASFDGNSAAKVHSKLSCPLRKRELPKTANSDLNWNVVARAPQRMEYLSQALPSKHNAEIASLLRREPGLRALISKLPVKAAKDKWSNVGEFKSLSELIGQGLKAAQVEEAETERVVTAEDATRRVFEFKRTSDSPSDSEKDELATHE
ncbi:MAG: hypothetical protein WAL47_10415 [Pyrinomonadaceae bacterium]